jgi:DNA-binding Xre family transcriptional regulator
MKKKELAELAGVSLATITKLGKEGSTVTTDILVKICVALNCELGDIVEIVPDTTLT